MGPAVSGQRGLLRNVTLPSILGVADRVRMLRILVAPDRLLMASGIWNLSSVPAILGSGFVLWHRMRSATIVFTQGLALLGPLFGLTVLVAAHISRAANRGWRELRQAVKQLEMKVRVRTEKLMEDKKVPYAKALKQVLASDTQLARRYHAAHRRQASENTGTEAAAGITA